MSSAQATQNLHESMTNHFRAMEDAQNLQGNRVDTALNHLQSQYSTLLDHVTVLENRSEVLQTVLKVCISCGIWYWVIIPTAKVGWRWSKKIGQGKEPKTALTETVVEEVNQAIKKVELDTSQLDSVQFGVIQFLTANPNLVYILGAITLVGGVICWYVLYLL